MGNKNYENLLLNITEIYQQSQQNVVAIVNKQLVETYWLIGRYIVEFEQKGNIKAEYGKALINNLSKDLSISLGKGFSRSNLIYMRLFYIEFPKGEKPSHLLSWSHYVDLVFYHRILKCFVLIDLKKEEASYEAVGQMNMYLGYFEAEENTEGDNPPIGIVLTKEKDELLVQYAMHNISSQLFVSKYQLYLPNRDELLSLISNQLNSEV